MKKNFLCLIILCLCLVTGCTKNYKTVQEYSDEMTALRKQLGDYTIEAVITTDDAETYVKSYIKDPKWKTETSKNNGKSYQDGILYDGKEVYSYSKKENLAMAIPFKQMIAKEKNVDAKTTDLVMKYINPTGFVYDWTTGATNLDNDLKFGDKNVVKNEFKCRMILSKTDDSSICVSDKYGVAVYAKIKDPKKDSYIEFNVKKIENNPLTENDLNLPAGMKKFSMAQLFQNMANMMK